MKHGWVWSGGVAVLIALPTLAHGHSRLTSPASRSVAVALQTAPCGGVARTATSTSFVAGQMVQVSFLEQQTHGSFALWFSPAGDANFTLLVGGIPALGSGMTHDVTVHMPAMPCTACTLQLVQQNGGSPYYSCADIRLDAPASTTTTTTPGGPTTSTTLAPSDPCAGLAGWEAADCRFTGAVADPPCGQEAVDPAFHDAVLAGLRRAQALARQAHGKTKRSQARRLLRKADRKLLRMTVRAARAAQSDRITGSCEGSIDLLIEELRATLAALLAPR
jgi:hypothetical protein